MSLEECTKEVEAFDKQLGTSGSSSKSVILCVLESECTIKYDDGKSLTLKPTDSNSASDGAVCLAKKVFDLDDRGTNWKHAETEFKMLRQCEHKNIVMVYQMAPLKRDSIAAFFMERGERSLCHALHPKRNGNFVYEPSIGLRLWWMKQAAEGLQFMHDKKILHRDVKSANMLLFDQGKLLKLCDLEHSRKKEQMMTSERGTSGWQAPEILSQGFDKLELLKYNEKVDCWSFGMVFYEVLFRQVPFPQQKASTVEKYLTGLEVDTREDAILKVVKGADTLAINIDWAKLTIEVARSVRKVVSGLLDFDHDSRLSMSDVLNDLKAIWPQSAPETLIPVSIESRDNGGSDPDDAESSSSMVSVTVASATNQLDSLSLTNSDVSVKLRPDCELSEDEFGKLDEIIRSHSNTIKNCTELTYIYYGRGDRHFGFSGSPSIEGAVDEINKLIYGDCQKCFAKKVELLQSEYISAGDEAVNTAASADADSAA